MRWVALAAAAVVVGYLLHRAMLWMEARGWVYYRSRGHASAGVVLGALDEVLRPSAQVTVVEQEAEERRGPRRPAAGDRKAP
jgi:hypothetical protein